jgi:signal transduction histidine kinase/CheY-like chemotaxis protein/HPt (histidine-containing phosphotransfer) domain-containing protein
MPIRVLAVLALALGFASLCSQTALYSRVQGWLEDAQQRQFAEPLAFENTIVFDVDEESMQRLDAKVGAWPYPRDVYARAARFLAASGARAVAYDILFSEARPGDDEFARALDAHSVLAAAALPYPLRRTAEYQGQLGRLALSVQGAPARIWPDLTLPQPRLTSPSGARAGVISAPPDDDGIVRRIHVLHRAYGHYLPSLTLGALIAAAPGSRVAFEAGALRLGERAWPLGAEASVDLRFPANTAALPVVPFYQLHEAAQGAPGTLHIGDLVNGKIVFIGSSSAILGDYVYTPVGQLSGLKFSALASELLLEGRVLRPVNFAIDALLVALALLLPALLVSRGPKARPREFAIGFALVLAVTAGAGSALFAAGQQSRWLFAALSGSSAQAAALCAWLLALYRERERLYYEKLAAEQANRMKTEFLNRMTHELRTPLTAITGFNTINQLSDDLGRAQRIRNSAIIARNCEHLLSLINDHLDVARIEAGQLRMDPRPVDPTSLFEDVITTMRVMADQKGLQLTLRMAGPLPAAVRLDALRLRQILLNLLGNAVKFTARGSVDVEVSWNAEMLEFSVRDTGPGIPAASLARIFEPFERGAGTKEAGTGLGLSVTRELVRLMQGTIDVASDPGTGTRFSVKLSAPEEKRATAADQAAAPAPAAASLAGRKILVADDNRDLRELLQFQLGELGMECTLVADGFEAVEAAARGGFDMVLLDMEMPRMNGWEAAHVLRAQGFDRPVIALTAHETARETERALGEGCDRILAKPCSIESLRATLAPLLEGTPAPAAASQASSPGRVDGVERPVVRVDPRIADLVDNFMDGARRDTEQARLALAARDLDLVRRIGHTLRGSASSYGFDAIARHGGILEHAARNEDIDSARRVVARLAEFLDRVEIKSTEAEAR